MWPTIDKEREALPITVERVDRQSYFLTCIVQYANLVHRISKEEIAGGVQNGEVNGKNEEREQIRTSVRSRNNNCRENINDRQAQGSFF